MTIAEDLWSESRFGKVCETLWDNGLSHELLPMEVIGTAFVQGSPDDCGTVICSEHHFAQDDGGVPCVK